MYESYNSNNIQVTSIADIVKMAKGEIVELPGFKSDQKVYFRLVRPSMLMLAKTGQIPNSLLSRAADLFSKGSRSFNNDDGDVLAESYDVLNSIARAAMVEPTMDQLTSNGVSLTDEQLMAIFNYTQNGVNSLSQFREQPAGNAPTFSLA